MADHGTYARYQQHKKAGEDVCGPCREAATAYMRARREANPTYRAKGRAQSDAYKAADIRLREAHPDEWEGYYAIERAVRGLTAVPKASGYRR